ncbi:NAD-dependent epimerase/dehydratase family protein [Cohnella cholangitidis]|uniref:NAD-dependent epimerase/dehydratase family protein n=1 Tax=Cohnella cholangitidis TaxID=2598458 RepID=A0A7G5BS70_9BACL|nr:NAD-dependent epimerase/dehydratase family protein [Cohnella cholangitidis]QMV39804.1 NAD-dependent epimerase/dehydratase family protein [Cohnella cholangitidis]
MTKALVTGATGFLGRATAIRLAELGWDVTGLGRDGHAGRLLTAQGVSFLQADLLDKEKMAAACADQDFVIHCAALSSPWGRYRDFYATNVTGTEHVVSGCISHGVKRLVHVSTPSVYFDYTDRLNITEQTALPRKPVNAYAATKLIAERIVTDAAVRGLPSVILRPRAIFGPGDTSLFPRLLRVNESRGIPIIGGGQAQLDLTFMDNVIDGLVQACTAQDSATGQIYNLTNGEPVKLIELLQRLFALLELPLRTRSVSRPVALAAGRGMEWLYRAFPSLGQEPQFTSYTVGLLAYSQTLDISKARRSLGYEPRIRIDEGLRRFADWWRNDRA